MKTFALLVSAVSCLCLATGGAGPELRTYKTPYYEICTDLPPEGAAEAVVRMTRLGEALRRRTRDMGLNAKVERLPFYLYARHADYLAASGAPRESAGVFLGNRLLAAATDARGSATWNVVQHEAFHQFPAAARGTEVPTWLNEGLAEYFGEAIFTGDGYVTGVVPSWRLARVRRAFSERSFQPLAGFARLSRDQWNGKLTIVHYDQAWSIVQFLLHGDAGQAFPRLVTYVRALGEGQSTDRAWSRAFGDWHDFELRWKTFWLALPDEGTPDLQTEATVATLTSFLARATAAGQTFDGFDAFQAAARQGTLRAAPKEWLPPSLLLRALDSIPKEPACHLEGQGPSAHVVTHLPTGLTLVGRFTLKGDSIEEVQVARDSR